MSKPENAPKGDGMIDLPNEDLLEVMTEAVHRVVVKTHEAGHWTSHIKDGNIVRVHPNGHHEIVRALTQR